MKKQILTIALCLGMSAVCVHADVVNTASKNLVAPSAKSSSDVLTAAVKNATNPPAALVDKQLQPGMPSKEQIKKQMEDRRLKEREALYKDLGLSVEQRQKALDIDSKAKIAAGPLARKFHVEARKLKIMKAKKASMFAIWKQKNAVKSAKNNLDKYLKASKKSFETILTAEQKVKYNAYEAKRKAEFEKFKQEHKNEGQNKGYHKGAKFPPGGPHGPAGMPPPPPPAGK